MNKAIGPIACAALLALTATGVRGAPAYAYIPLNTSGGSVEIIDLGYYTEVVNLTVAADLEYPGSVAINPAGSRVYVSLRRTDQDLVDVSGGVVVIDTHGPSILTTINNVGISPAGIAVHPDNSVVYVTHQDGVTVIDTATNSISGQISLPYTAQSVAFTRDGTFALVTGQDQFGQSGVSVVDVDTGTVADLALGDGAKGVAVNPLPGYGEAYVANNLDDSVSIVDLSGFPDNLSESRVLLSEGSAPAQITVAPTGNPIYVGNEGNGTVTVIDRGSATITDVVTLAEEGTIFNTNCFGNGETVHVTGMAIDPDGVVYAAKNMWCSSQNGTHFTKLVPSDGTLVETDRTWLRNERSSTQVHGQFIGPECADCPRGYQPVTPPPGYSRPAGLGPIEIVALGLGGLLLGLRGRARLPRP